MRRKKTTSQEEVHSLRKKVEPLISQITQKGENLWAKVVTVCKSFKKNGTYVEGEGKSEIKFGNLPAFARFFRDEFGFKGFSPKVVVEIIKPIFNLLKEIAKDGEEPVV